MIDSEIEVREGTIEALRTLRRGFVRAIKRLAHVHPTAFIHWTAHVRRDLVAGPHAFVGAGAHIGPKVEIGAYAMLAPRVAVVGGDHRISEVGVPMVFAGRESVRVTNIGADAWVGYGAVIMAGVSLGEGCVVGAGSVVTRDVEPYSIVVGIPAQPVGLRFASDRERDRHSAMLARPDWQGKRAERRP